MRVFNGHSISCSSWRMVRDLAFMSVTAWKLTDLEWAGHTVKREGAALEERRYLRVCKGLCIDSRALAFSPL